MDIWGIWLRCTVEHREQHTVCSAYLVPGTQCAPLRYTQSMWRNIPKILSLGTTGSVSVRGIFVNAQSLTKDKWDEVRTVGLRERVHIIAVAEVWGITNRDAQFMGYRRRLSRHMGAWRSGCMRTTRRTLRKCTTIDGCSQCWCG